jgi:hypothetical protein
MTLGALLSLLLEIESHHEQAGFGVYNRQGVMPPVMIGPVIQLEDLIPRIVGIGELRTFLNNELGKRLTSEAVGEVCNWLARKLRKPSDEIALIQLSQAVRILGSKPKAKAELTPAARAIAAAYDLQKEGKRVSVKAACDRAGVDRGHLREKYPEAITAIRKIATPGRTPHRGTLDRRTGIVDALDDREA